jgi:hypothetical protein
MQTGMRAIIAASLAMVGSLGLSAGTGSGVPAPTLRPREIYAALNALRIDATQIYAVNDLRLKRESVSVTFSEGTIGLLEAYDGRVTGAVFTGRGHVSANLRDPAERKSLAHFLGVPLLDQSFSGAYLRFDDASAEEILDQLRHAGAVPKNDADFVATWNKALPNLNRPVHQTEYRPLQTMPTCRNSEFRSPIFLVRVAGVCPCFLHHRHEDIS